METVLAAFFAVFLTVFAGLSLSATVLSTQENLRLASQAMQARLDDRSRTNIVPISAAVTDSGSVVQIVYRNEGATKVADFSNADVVVQYMDNATPTAYHIGWLPGTTGLPINNEWAIGGLYVNAAQSLPEVYEPGIFDPGEELRVSVKLAPPVGEGKTVNVVFVTENGVTASTQVTRNAPPILAINTGLSLGMSTMVTIDNTKLAVTDVDNTPDQDVYTITTMPTQGTLSLGPTFTQADINNGKLTYTSTGSSADSFAFTVADGEANIGPYTFTINP